jgi:hypothetical protein
MEISGGWPVPVPIFSQNSNGTGSGHDNMEISGGWLVPVPIFHKLQALRLPQIMPEFLAVVNRLSTAARPKRRCVYLSDSVYPS